MNKPETTSDSKARIADFIKLIDELTPPLQAGIYANTDRTSSKRYLFLKLEVVSSQHEISE